MSKDSDPPGPRDDRAAKINTSRLAEIADICLEACEDLVRQGHRPNGEKVLRRFGMAEIARHMLRLPTSELRALLRRHPELPQGPDFSLDEINLVRAHMDVLPRKPADQPAKILAACNFKGGVAKTTTAAHLAMAAALDGYRVLVVDLDSQASMSTLFGTPAEDEAGTAYAALAWDLAKHKCPTASPHENGEGSFAGLTADDLIRPTHWPTIDILPAQLNLYWAEFQVPVWLQANPGWPFWDGIGNFLRHQGLLDDYDLVFIDTPPALGYLTINALAAADIVLVPVGASYIEFDSTGRFFDMLHTTFASVEDALEASGGPKFQWDAVQVLLTRYDAAQQADMASIIEAYLGDVVAAERLAFTALVGQAGEQVSGLYEAAPSDFNRETYRRGRATFDEAWAGIRALVERCWARESNAGIEGVSSPQSLASKAIGTQR